MSLSLFAQSNGVTRGVLIGALLVALGVLAEAGALYRRTRRMRRAADLRAALEAYREDEGDAM